MVLDERSTTSHIKLDLHPIGAHFWLECCEVGATSNRLPFETPHGVGVVYSMV